MGAVEKIITDNLPIWSSAVQSKSSAGRGTSSKRNLYGVKKLRELIIDLAVRGLLVPQDQNDEPASVLLEKIAAEKENLINQKIIKNEKILINKDIPQLFVLKKGWSWSNLGSLGNIFNGNSINSKVKEEKYSGEEGIPFIATKDVGYGFESINYSNGVKIPKGEAKFKLATKNSVFICAEGGSAGKKCGISDQDVFFGNKLFANELYGDINPAFILACYLSDFFWQQFKGSMTGIIGGISRNKFICLAVPVPPIAEQHRIVTKVDELMALCDTLELQQEYDIKAHENLVEVLLETLTDAVDAESFQSAWQRISEHFDVLFTTEHSIEKLKETILQLAVMGKLVPQDPNDEPASVLLEKITAEKRILLEKGKIKKKKPLSVLNSDDIYTIPKNWDWAMLGDLGFVGSSSRVQKKDWTKGGVPFYRAREIVKLSKYGTVENELYISQEHFEVLSKNGLIPEENDIMLTGVGTIGVPYIVKPDDNFYFKDASVLIFKNLFNLPPLFLNYFFQSPFCIFKIHQESMGTTVHTLTISRADVVPVPLPPIPEQHRIVAKVDELMALCDQLKDSLQQAQQTQIYLTDAVVENAL